MKTRLSLILLVLIAFAVFSYPGSADAQEELSKNDDRGNEEPRPPSDFLESTESKELTGRISVLERRLDQLNQEKRFVEDKIENLERKLNDLRRAHR